MTEIVAVNIRNTLDKSKYNTLISYLSIEKKEKIGRFYRFEDTQRALIGDLLVRYLICNRLKIKNKNLVFKVNEYGKPFLADHDNSIKYNISHSGEWVACGIDNVDIGIDIEQIKSIDIGIAEKFFAKEELIQLMSKNIIEREEFFYDLWTLKESYIKAVGKGLYIPLNSFYIKMQGGNITLNATQEGDSYYFNQYYIDSNYKMAVCSRKNKFPYSIKFMDVNTLCEEVLQI